MSGFQKIVFWSTMNSTSLSKKSWKKHRKQPNSKFRTLFCTQLIYFLGLYFRKAKKKSPKGLKRKPEASKDSDSRSSTPTIEIGKGPCPSERKRSLAVVTPTPSSSQDSSSDVPKKKKSRLDPSVESVIILIVVFTAKYSKFICRRSNSSPK